MVHKAYNGSEYYAQTLAEFIQDIDGGGGYRVTHTGGTLSSRISYVNWIIHFKDGDNPHYSLEVSVESEILETKEGVMKVERGPSGRISGNHWKNFRDKTILPLVKRAAMKRPPKQN